MRHEGERLAFRLEARNHLRRVHSCFNDLERNMTMDGARLLGKPHLAHSAFA